MAAKQRTDFPQYQKALELYLSGQYQKLRKSLFKLGLSQVEKALIESRLMLKNNESKKVQERLSKIKAPQQFLEAEKEMVLANSFGFEANWELAAIHNLKAHELYKILNDSSGLFITSYNAAVDFSRLGHHKLAEYHYEKANQWAKTEADQVLVLRARALHSHNIKNTAAAKIHLQQALKIVKIPTDQTSTWLVAADLHWQWQEYDKAYEWLAKAASSKNVLDAHRLEFEKELMNWCLGKQTKLAYSFQLLDSQEYGLYAKLFLHLQNGDVHLAQASWYLLSKKFPERFSPEFFLLQPHEERTLLGSALQKWKNDYEKQNKTPKIALTNTEMRLFSLLQQQETPANKEWLIEQVWEKSFEPKDISKFYKLVERLRKKQIHVSKNSTGYFLK